jgi:poly-gamma-glutamate synthesis protein (capsule biosynthesis protein)
MLDRNVRKIGQSVGYESLFAGISPLLQSADVVAANLEGPITSNASLTLLPDGHTTKTLTFTASPATASVLKKSGIDLVSLSNNHSNDFGPSGLNETKSYLKQAGVQWFGSPTNSGSTEAELTVKGIKIAFVGYEQFSAGIEHILADVSRLSAAGDYVIVVAHWGVEYSATSTAAQRMTARRLVAAGAQAVIDSHPHQVEDKVYMGGVPVFYSVGNLLFDQYFSPETMRGNVVELVLSKSDAGTKLDDVKVFTTSTASHAGISVVGQPQEFK